MSNAWMIRNDGKEIPVTVHPYATGYGMEIDVEEVLGTVEWLYTNTRYDSTRKNVIKLIALWWELLDPGRNNISVVSDYIESRPYKFVSVSFVNKISSEAQSADILTTAIEDQLESITELISTELNQEFLRARFGGMYNTSSSSREMVFRVSSVGFNWYNIIWQFVYDRKSFIKTVTIVRDAESTGAEDYVYTSRSGEPYNQMPIDYFLMESGRPIVESLTKDPEIFRPEGIRRKLLAKLATGLSVHESLMGLPINESRGLSIYRGLNGWELEGRLRGWR